MIALLVAATFAAIAAVHVYWALGGRIGIEAAVPRAPVRPGARLDAPPRAAFEPGTGATWGVAVALTAVAVLVCLRAGIVVNPMRQTWLRVALGLVAAVMFLRALGDFKLVGFFKRPADSRFARMDTWMYSPLCVLLGSGLAFLAID